MKEVHQFRKKLISLENVNWNSSKKQRINSPCSIEALNNLGFYEEDLYFIDFQEFKVINPELLTYPKEIQISRYDVIEKIRQNKINQALDERTKIKNSNLFKSYNSTISKNIDSKNLNPHLSEEIQNYDKIKKKQEMDLAAKIQFELKREIIKQENEEKLRLRNEKIERDRLMRLEKSKMDENKKKNRDLEKKNQEIIEEEQRKREKYKKLVEIQEKERQDEENEKKRKISQKIKEEQDKHKQVQFKMKIEEMQQFHINIIKERQMKLEKRDEERKAALEYQRLLQIEKNKEKSEYQKKRLEIQNKNNEEKLKSREIKFMNKQKENEEKQMYFDQLRNMAFKQNLGKNSKKEEQIQNVLNRNKAIEENKINEYYNKQFLINQRKLELEEIKKEENKRMLIMKKEREEKIKNTLIKNNTLEEEKKYKIIAKINTNDSKILKVRMNKERELMEKCEDHNIKQIYKKENKKRIDKFNEIKCMKTLMKLEEKNQKYELLMKEKSLIFEKKQEIQKEISKKKDEFIEKIGSVLKKKHLDEKSLNSLQNFFKGNDDLNSMILTMKSNHSFRPQSTNPKGHQNKKHFNDYFDFSQDIKERELLKKFEKKKYDYYPNTKEPNYQFKMISKGKSELDNLKIEKNSFNQMNSNLTYDELKIKLNQQLLKVLELERQKEAQREFQIQNCQNEEEKLRLEKLFSVERSLASQMIYKINEEIERKLEEFQKDNFY